VEAVAWASNRSYLLPTLFALAATLAYLGKRPLRIWLSCLCFLCSLLAKPIGMTLPLVLLVFDLYLLGRLTGSGFERFKNFARRCAEKLPFFLLASAGAVVSTLAKADAGILATPVQYGLRDRLLQCGYATLFYPLKTLFPDGLTVLYKPPGGFEWNEKGLIYFSVPLLLLLTGALGLTRRRIPLIWTAWLSYLILLLPVTGLVRYGSQSVADKWAYLPSIPLALLAGGALRSLGRPWATAGIIGGSLLLSLQQIQTWKDSGSLWNRNLLVNPKSASAHNNLGAHLAARQGTGEKIGRHYGKALRSDPDHSDALCNIGTLLNNEGHIEEALVYYRRAAEIEPASPDMQNHLGLAYLDLNHPQEARRHFEEAIRLDERFAEAHYNLGVLNNLEGKTDEAIEQYLEAIRIQPDQPEAHNNLANILARRGRIEEALHHFRQAILQQPDYAGAYYNLGTVLSWEKRFRAAETAFREVLRIQPDHRDAHYNLGVVLNNLGRAEEAIPHFEAAGRFPTPPP
jgi:tetratricopeptide (TPR) repeat protein